MFPLLFTTEMSSVLSEVLQAIQFCLIDKCFFQKHRLSQLHSFLCIFDTELKTKNTKISYAISALRSLCNRVQTRYYLQQIVSVVINQFPYSTFFEAFGIIYLFYSICFSCSNRCVLVAHCAFNCHFSSANIMSSIFSCAYLPFLYLL